MTLGITEISQSPNVGVAFCPWAQLRDLIGQSRVVAEL